MTSFSRIGGRGSSTSRVVRTVLALGACLVTVGAGAFGGGCSSGIDLSTEAAFCAAVAQTDCNPGVVGACYLANAATSQEDTQKCIDAVTTPERCNPLNLPYHAEFAQGCLNAHANLYGNAPSLDPGALAAKNSACAAVFNNGGQTGASCKADTDCDVGNNYSCLIHEGGKGSCQIPVAVMPGENCELPASQCPQYFYCAFAGQGQSCIASPTVGASCGDGVTCDSRTSFCKLDSPTATKGACESLLPDQTGCTADEQCQGGFCIAEGSGDLCAGNPAPLTFGTPSCTSTFTQ